jgi:hypothetical protein
VCGAWVLEPQSEVVLGIVVAHSRASSLTWILPMNKILADIKSRWESQGIHISSLTKTSDGEASPKHRIEHHPGDHEAAAKRMRSLLAYRSTDRSSTSNSVSNLPVISDSNDDDAKTTGPCAEHPLNRVEQAISLVEQAISLGQYLFKNTTWKYPRLTKNVSNEQDATSNLSSVSAQSDIASPVVFGPRGDGCDRDTRTHGESGE